MHGTSLLTQWREALAENLILLPGKRQGDTRQKLGSMQSLNIPSLMEALGRYVNRLPTRL